jgi:MoaA/NifB/PqqE/SkfB family radical SAM enzyme
MLKTDPNKEIIIFGTDGISVSYVKSLMASQPEKKILCFLDESSPCKKKEIDGVPVESAEEYWNGRRSGTGEPSGSMIHVIANQNSRYKKLTSLGYEEDKDFSIIPELSLIRLYATSICNAACKMCDIGLANQKGIDRIRKSENTEISPALVEKLLNEPYLKNNKLKFSIGMVEPLVHHRIGDIVGMIKKQGHSVAVLTNGILLEKKARELVENDVDYVVVSIDGPEEVHDRIRGRSGIYRSAINGMKALKQLNPELRVVANCAVSNLNCAVLAETAESLEREKVPMELQFQHLYFVSEKMAHRHNSLHLDRIKESVSVVSDIVSPGGVDLDVLEKQIEKLKQFQGNYIKRLRVRPDVNSSEGLARYFNEEGEKIEFYDKCFFPYSQVSIKTNGEVLFHSRCFEYVVGNLMEETIHDIFHSDAAAYFRKNLKENDYCFPACTRCCGVMGGW